jgi:hypothetical protein
MVKFDKATHTYTNVITNEKYISCTTLLGKYVKPFDSDYHAERVAKREGVSKEFILDVWKQQNELIHCIIGSTNHMIMYALKSLASTKLYRQSICFIIMNLRLQVHLTLSLIMAIHLL